MSTDETTAVGTGAVPGADTTLEEGIDLDSTDAAADGEDVPVTLPLDQVFEMVKNERRRLAIAHLRDQPGEVTLGELAEHIAAIENDKPVKAISSKERKRVYVGLYQCHLPKMDDLDIVEFNQNRGRVRLGPNAERLYPYIDPEDDSGDPGWARVYFGLALLGGLSLVAALALGAAGGVVPVVIAGGLVCSVSGCALFQFWRQSGSS